MTVLTKETFSSFFSFRITSNNLIWDVSIKLRPYGVLIGLKNCSLEKSLSDSKFLWLHIFCTMQPDLNMNLSGVSNVLLYVAREL